MNKTIHKAPRCILGRQLDDLDGSYKEKLQTLLNQSLEEGGLPIKMVVLQLKRAGFRASNGGVSEHRSKVCLCNLEGDA